MGYLREGDPARYHLAATETGIQVAVNKMAVPQASDFPERKTREFAQENGLISTFIPPTVYKEWGYDGSIVTMDMQNPDWVLYECPLPPAFNEVGEQDYDALYSSAASLKLLFDALNYTEKDSNAKVSQNLFVQLALDRSRGMWGAPINVRIYPPLAEFIGDKLNKRGVKKVESTMKDLFYRMWSHEEDKREGLFDNQFRLIRMRGNLIYLQTFGNACDLGPEMEGSRIGEPGYEMTPHNTDNAMQQLSLLAGIATIEALKTGAYFRANPNQLTLNLPVK